MENLKWFCFNVALKLALFASERSERDTIRGVQIRAGAVYICMEVLSHNSSACRAYVMWAELVHFQFLYLPAVINVVTTGNDTSTKMF